MSGGIGYFDCSCSCPGTIAHVGCDTPTGFDGPYLPLIIDPWGVEFGSVPGSHGWYDFIPGTPRQGTPGGGPRLPRIGEVGPPKSVGPTGSELDDNDPTPVGPRRTPPGGGGGGLPRLPDLGVPKNNPTDGFNPNNPGNFDNGYDVVSNQ